MPKRIHDLIGERYGVRVAHREYPGATTAEVASGVIARRNPSRIALYIMNLSAATVWAAPRPSVSSAAGIPIPAGGTLSTNFIDDFIVPSLEWSIIAGVGASAIYVLSVEIEPEEHEAATP